MESPRGLHPGDPYMMKIPRARRSSRRFFASRSCLDWNHAGAGRFHGQSQNSAGPDTTGGRRYLESATNGWQFQLFVRPRRGEAYCACGPLLLESAEGDRPMSLVWQFQAPLRGFAAHWSFLPFMPTGSASPTRCREVGLSRPMFASITDAASA